MRIFRARGNVGRVKFKKNRDPPRVDFINVVVKAKKRKLWKKKTKILK